MRPYILAETNYAYTKANPYEVAVLPLGATEPHNLHLPYGTDVFEGTIVGEKICEAAHRRGAKVVLLPTIPYGTETNMTALSAGDERRSHDAVRLRHRPGPTRCVTSGVRKIVLLNSHGGNEMKPLLRELAGKIDGAPVPVQLVHRARRRVARALRPRRTTTRGEMETSFVLAYSSAPGRQNAPTANWPPTTGRTAKTRFDAVNRGWVSITRPWHLLTTNTGSGYPHAAAAEKAEHMMDLLVERLGTFLVRALGREDRRAVSVLRQSNDK